VNGGFLVGNSTQTTPAALYPISTSYKRPSQADRSASRDGSCDLTQNSRAHPAVATRAQGDGDLRWATTEALCVGDRVSIGAGAVGEN
jgi:hypothetical protein